MDAILSSGSHARSLEEVGMATLESSLERLKAHGAIRSLRSRSRKTLDMRLCEPAQVHQDGSTQRGRTASQTRHRFQAVQ